jgi:hypothetical protein
MLGFSHMLDSSASSSSSSLYSEADADFDPASSAAKKTTQDKDDTDVFLKHMRKCFITTDEDRFCESGIMPDMMVFCGKARRLRNKTHDNEAARTILSRRIDSKAYEYVKIYSNLQLSLLELNANH